MGAVAPSPDDDEGDSLTRLDLVKHSLKTVIATLDRNDRLALIDFNTTARNTLKMVKMDDAGRRSANTAVNRMQHGGCTELWKGIEAGLELMRGLNRGADDCDRTRAVLVLTDGEPSDRGHLESLKAYQARHPTLDAIVSTFGFTYTLNSTLLHQIASECGGLFTFIPDASFVGTAFVNNLANLLTTAFQRLSVIIEPLDGAGLICPIAGSAPHKVALGPGLFGQQRSAVVRVSSGPKIGDGQGLVRATVTSGDVTLTEGVLDLANATILASHRDSAAAALAEKFRLAVEPTLKLQREQCLSRNDSEFTQPGEVATLIKTIRASVAAGDPKMEALLEDLEGQVTEACSSAKYFTKWGVHYLTSLGRSHTMQQCSNFKDPGLQVYGGETFGEIRDAADEIFVSLPPPKPDVKMETYYNCSGGCFAGDCTVTLATGGSRRVRDLRKGDVVASANGGTAAILCVVRTRTSSNIQDMVRLAGGLVITPYHPVRLGTEWHFPVALAPAEPVVVGPWVFTFVLDGGHVLCVNGIEACTLGHGFEAPVVAHSFLGTHAVVHDLSCLSGWDSGMVSLTPDSFRRDKVTGEICAIDPPRWGGGAIDTHDHHPRSSQVCRMRRSAVGGRCCIGFSFAKPCCTAFGHSATAVGATA